MREYYKIGKIRRIIFYLLLYIFFIGIGLANGIVIQWTAPANCDSTIWGLMVISLIYIAISSLVIFIILSGLDKRFLEYTYELFESRRPSATQQAEPESAIDLSSAATDRFTVFPLKMRSRPDGYVDLERMSACVNDDLVARTPRQQSALLGFGNGFLAGIRSRLPKDEEQVHVQFRIINASAEQKMSLGWLVNLHYRGAGYNGPSTANLHSFIRNASANLKEEGPVTRKYSERNKPNESGGSYAVKAMSPEILLELMSAYELAFEDGQQLARVAVMMVTPR